MVDTTFTDARGAPWHLWLVGVLAVLWNGFGAYLYVMTQLRGGEFILSLGATQAAVDWQMGLPAWMNALWAIATWGGVLGGVLLLLRLRWALHAFLVTLLAMLVSLAASFGLFGALGIYTTGELVQTAVMTLIGIGFVLYARAMIKRGVLR